MKLNKVYSLLLVLVAGLVMVSCKAKSDVTYDAAACQAAAGKYAGTWTMVEKDNPDNTKVESGYFTITATDDRNVAKVSVAFGSEQREDVCNIAHRGENGFVFYNNAPQKFGSKFSGEIYPDHGSDMQFQLQIIEGRKKKTYNFQFLGSGADFVPAN